MSPNVKAGTIGLGDLEVSSGSDILGFKSGNLCSLENSHLFRRKADIIYYQIQEQHWKFLEMN